MSVRRSNLGKIRAELKAADQRRLESLRVQLRRSKVNMDLLREHIGLICDDDLRIVLDAISANSGRDRGSPKMLEGFHGWIAAHALWLREHGHRNVSKTVQRAWKISEAAVKQAERNQAIKARELVDCFGSSDPSENFACMASAFVRLGETEINPLI